MRVDDGRIQVYREGRVKSIDPFRLPYFQKQGWSLDDGQIRATLKPAKQAIVPEVTAVIEEEQQEPTNTEE